METNRDDLDRALDTVQANAERVNYSPAGTNGKEDEYSIVVKNANSIAKEEIFVYPYNTLGQVLDKTREDLGIKEKQCINFVNEDTGEEETDANVTLGEFGIKEGGSLIISPDARVAFSE